MLIGRAPELERIDAAIARRTALPAGLLFHGSAGIGKTTIWRETVQRARRAGFVILESAPTAQESRLAYAGLADLVGPVLAEVLPALAPPQAQALEAALAMAGAGDTPDERAVAFALHGALAWLARRGPIALAVDDIQWLDPSSALMLSYAIRRFRSEPVLLVFAQRESVLSDHAQALLRGGGVEFERVGLGSLPLGALHRLIRRRLGASLTRPQLLRVHAASAGNPLHALELARAIRPDGVAPDDGLASLLAHRIAALPEPTREAISLVALAAESDVEFLAEAYGSGFRRHLRPAIEADLVRIAADAVRFEHPLMAVAAESGVSARQRAGLHRRLAGVARSPESRAMHLEKAAGAPDAEVADALEAAARSTLPRGARAASAALFEGAARMTPPADPATRDRRLLAAAEAWYEAGDGGHAAEILERLLESLPHGDQRCEAAWRLGILRDEANRWQEAMELWRGSLADGPEPGLRSRILGSLAITTFYTGSVAEAADLAAASLDAAERSTGPGHVARALAVLALTRALGGGAWQDLVARALGLEASLDESMGAWSPSAVAAECARHTGDPAGAVGPFQAVLRRAVNAGDANQEQWAAYGLASTLLLTGDYGQASELADTVLDLADQTGQMRIPARTLRASVDAYLGHLDAARREVDGAMSDATAADEATFLFNATVVLAFIETSAGRSEQALAAHAAARLIAGTVGLRHATALRAFVAEAETAATAGRPDQAEAAMTAVEDAVAGTPPAWTSGILHAARGARLAAGGQLAEAHDEIARGQAGAAELPFDRARALLAMGGLSRRLREHARAREELGRAVAAFTELGAAAWAEQARRELARIPGRRSRRPDELTEAESTIAAMVAKGRSNREVAAALFVSVKTVESALTRIYEKLGVRSRAELAHAYTTAAKD